MKIKLLISGLLLSALTQAQVGVDTRTPQSSLDVNGDFGLRKRIFLDNNSVDVIFPLLRTLKSRVFI